METAQATLPEASRGKLPLLGLAAMASSVFIISNDFTGLSVAMPTIEKEFGVDITTGQWMLNGYTLMFGVLIVSGGRLADIFGRRNMFFMGSALFATASILGALSTGIGVLLTARFLMGVGGALMWPAMLGLTYSLLPPERTGLAGATVTGSAGLGNAAGPLIGGVLTDYGDWRMIFLVNVPVVTFGALAAWIAIREERKETIDRRIDFPGIAVLSGGILTMLIALDMGAEIGWFNDRIAALLFVSALALSGFVLVERRSGDRALVPHRLWANPTFKTACIATLLMSALYFSAVLYLPRFMIANLGDGPMQAGMALLPMMAAFCIASFFAGPAYDRYGAKVVVAFGAAALAAGMMLLAHIGDHTTYTAILPGTVVLGIGIGAFYTSITTTGVTAVMQAEASLAGAVLYMCQVGGGAIGLALNTAIVSSSNSMADGIGKAFFVDGLFALAGFVVVILYVGGTPKWRHAGALPFHGSHG